MIENQARFVGRVKRSTIHPIHVLVTALLVGVSGSARAQFMMQGGSGSENIQGISVAGKGIVSAKPNLVEIDLDVQASSELTADAIVKYRDAKTRLRDAFTALKLDNVTVEERGLLVDQKSGNAEYVLLRRPAEHAEQDRGAAHSEARRESREPSQDGRGSHAPACRPAPRRRAGRRGTCRSAQHVQSLLL